MIQLAPHGTYVLTVPDNSDNGLPVIRPDGGKKLSILGQGAILSRSVVAGTPAFRIFYILPGSEVVIDGLTISNGAAFAAAGLFNDNAKVTILNSTLTRNIARFAGAIQNTGRFGSATLTVANSTFSDNLVFRDENSFGSRPRGGAIYCDGEYGMVVLNVTGCTFARNSAGEGGAIYNRGDGGHAALRITTSTFSENTARFFGGAIHNLSDFGDAPLRVISSTFSLNSASTGGAIYNTGENGTAAIEIGNSIFLSGSSGGNLFNRTPLFSTFTPVISLGYNVISDDNDGSYGSEGLLHGPGDQRGTDPLLDPDGLQDNGGPTETIALMPGSPAIDKGKNIDSTAQDQRGFLRTHDFPTIAPALGGDNTDAGAYELHPDADGDGIPDYLDHCPASDLRATVWIGAFNTSVPNSLFNDGCTIADLIAEQAARSANHGQFVSAVAKLTNDLVRQGVLSGTQKGILQRSAAKAAIP